MTVPRGMFAPGAKTGLARQQSRPMVPLEWIRAHPLTKRWWARALRDTLGAPFATDVMIQLPPNIEGYIRDLMIVGGWNNGANDGRNWAVLVDGASPIDMNLLFGAGVAPPSQNRANLDILPGGSDGTQTWCQLDLWLPENALVELTYNNNGGSAADQVGGVMYGYYWPISLREEWVTRGWKR